MIERIISGGQTGADRGGLDAAMELGLKHGGWCPAERFAEDGVVPARYQLREHRSRGYRDRTRSNVRAADATVVFVASRMSPGSGLTVSTAVQLGKPFQIVRLDRPEAEVHHLLSSWLVELGPGPHTLNVAGTRESKAPGIGDQVRRVLVRALQTASAAADPAD